jgi:hypothetical protein
MLIVRSAHLRRLRVRGILSGADARFVRLPEGALGGVG